MSHSLLNSDRLFKEALTLIPNGVQTLSKSPDRFVNGVYPKFLKSADGCVVEDVDGNLYTDYICGLGPIVLGYRDREVDKKVKERIDKGFIFSLEHQDGIGLAERLKKDVPCAKMSKFFKTGSDALSAAVKVARAYTGKDKVLVCGYHGWHDWYTICNDKKRGIPKAIENLCLKFKYNDIESLTQHFELEDVAAVVMEPTVYDEPRSGFLERVKEIAHAHGALLIFDEVVTGIRFGLGGAQSYFNVNPDLAAFSKALGNGYPIAALTGYPEYMKVYERDDFFISGTFGGELIGITAASAVIDKLRKHDYMLKRLWDYGNRLKSEFNAICRLLGLEQVNCQGYAPRTTFNFPSTEHKALFWQECVRQNILFGYANFISASHTALVIENTLNVCETSLRVVKDNWNDPRSRLEGEMPTEVFNRVRP